MKKHLCIISHTHWDREWYQPFEQFRIRLVDLIDHLLDIIEMHPDYIFHLDAQTIVLEDYLEIKPMKKEILQKHIKNGNIIVGPWYVQNDFYLTSGEATVRNLIYGTKMAEEFGSCAKVGYAPDQFGIISQLPQILKDFGSDNCIFGRGYTCFIHWQKGYEEFKKIAPPSEFIWKGVDGTKILGIHMTYWYSNCQRISEDETKAVKLVNKILKSFEGIATTPYLLLMNGVDHLEPQENLLPIIDNLNKNLSADNVVKQITMQNYIDNVKSYLGTDEKMICDKIPTYDGELRTGSDGNLLQNTFSSRIYLKALNTKAQNTLENVLEPLYSFICMACSDCDTSVNDKQLAFGLVDKYPQEYMDYLWKLLIKNHPHDSICGCSHDDVHTQMEDRYNRFFNTADVLVSKGLEFISNHTSRENIKQCDYIVTICNFTEILQSGVVEVHIEIPIEENINGFSIVDKELNNISFEVVSVIKRDKSFCGPINLPGVVTVNDYTVRLFAENIKPFSVETYIVKTNNKQVKIIDCDNQTVECAEMENDFIKAAITPNGEINITDKVNNHVFNDIFMLEDTEDVGNAYNTKQIGLNPITTKGLKPIITKISDTDIRKQYKMSYKMMLPKNFDNELQARRLNMVENEIDVILTLNKDAKMLEFDVDFENKSSDHRLRALINTGIDTEYTYASAPYDVIKRDRNFTLDGYHNGDQPNSGFVDIIDSNKALAVLTDGIYEYKHYQEQAGVMAFTLVRATNGINGYVFKDNQCKRQISVKMAVMPHSGNYINANLEIMRKHFQCGFISTCLPADTKKFTGGRAAVQETDIKEIFFHKDKYENLVIGKCQQMFDITGEGIVITAVKKAQDSEKYIIRLNNISETVSKLTLNFYGKAKDVYEYTMEEKEITKIEDFHDNYKLNMTSKKIITLAVRM